MNMYLTKTVIEYKAVVTWIHEWVYFCAYTISKFYRKMITINQTLLFIFSK